MKRYSHLILILLLLVCTLSASAQEVFINIRTKGSDPRAPLPPYAAAFLSNPEQFFNVSITNPGDQAVDIYMGVRLEQTMTVDGGKSMLPIYTPENVQPPMGSMSVIHLMPSTTKMLNVLQMREMFTFYDAGSIVNLAEVTSNIEGNETGLLPEGSFKLTLYAYDLTGGGQLISDPDRSFVNFDIRYKANPPEIIQIGSGVRTDHSAHPHYRSEYDELPGGVVDINLNEKQNLFTWSKVVLNTSTYKPKANYRLEIYELTGTEKYGLSQLAKEFPAKRFYYYQELEMGMKLVEALTNTSLFPSDEFYAVRVVAEPLVTQSNNWDYMMVGNDGASEWRIIYNSSKDFKSDGADLPTTTGKDKDKEENWRLSIEYPRLTKPDNEGSGFARHLLTADKDGNIEVEWLAPGSVEVNNADKDANLKMVEKLEYKYDFFIYKIDEGETDLELVMEKDPIYKTENISKLNTKVKWKDIEKKIELNQNYIMVVMPKVSKPDTKTGEVSWTGTGVNCFTFGYYLTAAQKFQGCGDKEVELGMRGDIDLSKGWHWKTVPDKVEKDTKVPTFYVGDANIDEAFELRLLPGATRSGTQADKLKDDEASKFSGDAVVYWQPEFGSKHMNIAIHVTLTDAEFNRDGQMVKGTCKSKKRTDADWLPYNLFDYTKLKAEGWFANDPATNTSNTELKGFDKWVHDNLEKAGDAVTGGVKGLVNKAVSPEFLQSQCGKYYDRIITYGQAANDVLSIADAIAGADLHSEPILLPLRMPSDLTELIHTDISLMSMEFTPGGATMNAMMIFNMPDGEKITTDDRTEKWESYKLTHPDLFVDADGNPLEGDALTQKEETEKMSFDQDYDKQYELYYGGSVGNEKNGRNGTITYSKVLTFTVNDMCMSRRSLWAESGTAALAYDIDIHDMSNDFYFRFKAPKDPNKIESVDDMSGCAIHWDRRGDKFEFALALTGEFDIPGLKDKDGKENVKASFGFKTVDWSDFTVNINLDPFTIDEAPGFVFNPAGGIVWDHSKKHNEEGVKFPDKYADKTGYDWSKYDAAFSKELADKPVMWQGLYIKKVGVEFPGSISVRQTERRDTVSITQVNVSYDTSWKDEEAKFEIAIEDLIWDKTGLTMCGGVNNVLDLNTCRLGGWGLSIDKIHFDVIQNNFRGCGFDGKIQIPLLDGSIGYTCDIEMQTKAQLDRETRMYSERTEQGSAYNADSKVAHLVFKTFACDSLNLDFLLGKLFVDEKGAWIKINHLPGYGTDIEFMASGRVTIDSEMIGDESPIPFSLPGIHFVGLRLANFSVASKGVYPGKTDEEQKDFKTWAYDYANTWKKDNDEEFKNLTSSKLNLLLHSGRNAENWVTDVEKSLIESEIQLGGTDSDGKKKQIFFGLGDWSFASGDKKFFDCKFNIDRFKFGSDEYDNDGKHVGKNESVITFGVYGGLDLMQKSKKSDSDSETDEGGALSAKVGLTIRSKIKYDLSLDFDKWDIAFDGVRFDSIAVKGYIGGGTLEIEGGLHMRTDSIKGFDGNLALKVMGVNVAVAGGYYNMIKTAEELAASSWDVSRKYSLEAPDVYTEEVNKRYKAFFVTASVSSKTGIPIPGTGISINSILGGFYWNYTLPEADATNYDGFVKQITVGPKPKFGGSALALGLGLKWGEEAASIDGKFSLLVGYDMERNKFGQFKLMGNVKALKGVVNATVAILYAENGNEEDVDYMKHFNVTCTVDAKADCTEVLAEFLGEEAMNKIKTFVEQPQPSSLTEMTNGSADKGDKAVKDDSGNKDTASEKDAKTSGDKAAKEAGAGSFTASASAHVSLILDIKSWPNQGESRVRPRREWYVNIGEPDEAKRCSVTLIDMSAGKGDYKLWAKVYANAYLCFGNVLPGNGDLPELPAKLKTFLEGDVSGGSEKSSVSKEGGQKAALDAARQEVINAMCNNGLAGKDNNGGVMFGMQAGADFGCRFGIGYTEFGGLVGFDMVMKMMKDNCKCLDEKGRIRPIGGRGGAYAEGQVYAYLYGSAGLILNLGFWSGDVPFVDMKLGAVLKGGFPNPTWAYGKLRARGELFGGLITFNKKLEMKMGQVCMPLVGNPLDNIDIFNETSIGYETKSEADDPAAHVPTYSPLTFTTNMAIGRVLDIIDEDAYQAMMGMSTDKDKGEAAYAKATRSFKFYVDPNMVYTVGNREIKPGFLVENGASNMAFSLSTGQFEPETDYKVTLRGYCKEVLFKGNRYVEEDPYIRDLETNTNEQRAWSDTKNVYFHTRPYTKDMAEAAALVGPYDFKTSFDDIRNPYICLRNPIATFEEEGIEILADLEEIVYTRKGSDASEDTPEWTKYYILPDQLYSNDGNYRRLTTTKSAYQGHRFRQSIEEGVDALGHNYKYITAVPYNKAAIQALKLEEGKHYRWIFYQMDTGTLGRLTKAVDESYTSMRSGHDDAIDNLINDPEVQEWLNSSKDGSSLIADMINEFQSEGDGPDTDGMEKRISSIQAGAYSQGSLFRSDILAYEFEATGKQSFRQQLQEGRVEFSAQRRLRSLSTGVLQYPMADGGVWVRPMEMVLKHTTTEDYRLNPYHRLYMWQFRGMYPSVNARDKSKNLARGDDMADYSSYVVYSLRSSNKLKNHDYYEDGHRLGLYLTGGFRLRKSTNDQPDILETDLLYEEYNNNNLFEMKDMNAAVMERWYNPGNDKIWRRIADIQRDDNVYAWDTNTKRVYDISDKVQQSSTGLGYTEYRTYLDNVYGTDSVVTVSMPALCQLPYQAYVSDCRLVKSLDDAIHSTFKQAVLYSHSSSYNNTLDRDQMDALAINDSWYTGKRYAGKESVYSEYVTYLAESQLNTRRVVKGDYEFADGKSYINFPRWQVQAMYFTSRYHLADRHNEYRWTSWLRPFDAITGVEVNRHPMGPDFDLYVRGDESVDFDVDAAVNDVQTVTYMVMRPDRFNVAAASTNKGFKMFNDSLQVSKGALNERALYYTLPLKSGKNSYTSDPIWDMESGPQIQGAGNSYGVEFIDPEVEKVVKEKLDSIKDGDTSYIDIPRKADDDYDIYADFAYSPYLGKGADADDDSYDYDFHGGKTVRYYNMRQEDLDRITELYIDGTSADAIKTLEDLVNLPNLETLVWNVGTESVNHNGALHDPFERGMCVMPKVEFTHNPKLKKVVVYGPNCAMDFSTCPNLESLEIIGNNNLFNILDDAKRYDRLMSMDEIDLSHCPKLRDIKINYTTLKDIDLGNNPDLTSIDISHNMIGNDCFRKGVMYTFDFSSQRNLEECLFGYQMVSADRGYNWEHTGVMYGNTGRYLYLDISDDLTEKSMWDTNHGGRMCQVTVPTQQIENLLRSAGACGDPHSDDPLRCVVAINGSTDARATVNADLSNLDDNLRIHLLHHYGEDRPGAPKESQYQNTQVEYWLEQKVIVPWKLREVEALDCSNAHIRSLANLNCYMPNLKSLKCSGNQLKSLDLRPYRMLQDVDCSGNRIGVLSLSGANSGMRKLNCSGNKNISELKTEFVPDLTVLLCSDNNLSSLDLSKMGSLSVLECANNRLTGLDLSQCTVLTELVASYNMFGTAGTTTGLSVILPDNEVIRKLHLAGNTDAVVPMLDYSVFESLEDLDLSDNGGIAGITINSDALRRLDISNTSVESVLVSRSKSGKRNVNLFARQNNNAVCSLEVLVANHTNIGVTDAKGEIGIPPSPLKLLDLSETKVDRAYLPPVNSYAKDADYSLEELYMGQKVRYYGYRIALCVGTSCSQTLAQWDRQWKRDSRNANVYAYCEDTPIEDVREALKSEVFGQEDLRLQKALGESLYEDLRLKYCPDKQKLDDNALNRITALDTRGYGTITDIDYALRERMPKLQKLHLAQSTYDDDRFLLYRHMGILELDNYGAASTPQTIYVYTVSSYYKSNKGRLAIRNQRIATMMGTLKNVYSFRDIDFTGTTFEYDPERRLTFDDNSLVTYAKLDSTNITSVTVSKDNLERLSLVDCPDLEELALLTDQLIDSTKLDIHQTYPNKDFYVRVYTVKGLRKWITNMRPEYPDVPVKMTMMFKNMSKSNVVIKVNSPKWCETFITTAKDKALGITLSEYLNARANTADEDAVLSELFPTDSLYIAAWKAYGKYPDGIHYDELAKWNVVDITGAVIMSPERVFMPFKALNKFTAKDNTIRVSEVTLPAEFCKYLRSLDFSGNPMLNRISLNGMPAKSAEINVDRSGISSDAFPTLLARFSKVRANHIGSVRNVSITSTDSVTSLNMSYSNVELVEIGPGTKMAYLNMHYSSAPELRIRTSWLPKSNINFTVDNSDRVSVVFPNLELVQRWYSIFNKSYLGKVKVYIATAGVEIPVSSYADAVEKYEFYSSLPRYIGTDWQEKLKGASISLNYRKVPEDVVKYIWSNAPNMYSFSASNDGLKDLALNLPETATPVSTLNLPYNAALETVCVNGRVERQRGTTAATQVLVNNCRSLKTLGNLAEKFEKVTANDCPALTGKLDISPDAKVTALYLDGTAYTEINMGKDIANFMMCSIVSDSVMITTPYLGANWYFDADKPLTIRFDKLDNVKMWYSRYASKYPKAKVQYIYNDKWLTVTSFDDAQAQAKAIDEAAKTLLGMDDDSPYSLDEIEVIDVSGSNADNEFFNYVANFMPRLHTIIAEAGELENLRLPSSFGTRPLPQVRHDRTLNLTNRDLSSIIAAAYSVSNIQQLQQAFEQMEESNDAETGRNIGSGTISKVRYGVSEETLVIPQLKTPLKELRLTGNTNLKNVDVQGYIDPASRIFVGKTGISDLAPLTAAFYTVNAVEDTSLGSEVTVGKSDACRVLNISGTPVNTIHVETQMQTLIAKDLDGDVRIYTEWLPQNSHTYNFVIDNSDRVTVCFTDRTLVDKWFGYLAAAYPDVKVQYYDGISWLTVTNAESIDLAPLSTCYPDGLTKADLADMTEIRFDGATVTPHLVDYLWANMPKLEKWNGDNSMYTITFMFVESFTVPASAGHIRDVNINAWQQVREVNVDRDLGPGSYINLASTMVEDLSSALANAETVIADYCYNVPMVVIPADARVKTLSMMSPVLRELVLNKAVKFTAHDMMSPLTVTFNVMPTSADMFDITTYSPLTVRMQTADDVMMWYKKFESRYPDAIVQLNIGTLISPEWTDIPKNASTRAFLLEYHQSKNTSTYLDIRGQNLTNDQLEQYLSGMPKVQSVIAESTGVADSEVVIPSIANEYVSIDFNHDTDLKAIDMQGYASRDESTLTVNYTAISSLDGLVDKFTNINARSCPNLTGTVDVPSNAACRQLSLTGSATPVVNIGSSGMTGFAYAGTTAPAVTINTVWLPAEAADFDIPNDKKYTVVLRTADGDTDAVLQLIRHWFTTMSKGKVKVSVEIPGEGTATLTGSKDGAVIITTTTQQATKALAKKMYDDFVTLKFRAPGGAEIVLDKDSARKLSNITTNHEYSPK